MNKINKIYNKIFNFKKLNPTGRGFSLIETVLYLAIVGILLVAVVDFNLTLSGTASKLGANIKVSQNRRTTLNAIDYLVRNSDGLLKDVNGFCMSSSSLALYFDDDTYLPGTCVESGGGVFITNSSARVKLSCAPNISNNGQYGACAATLGNSYYLSSPDISVATSGGLVFSTSTATSTFSGFLNLSTSLTFTNISNSQTELLATSTASSTVTLRNQQNDALLAWWKFDDAVDTEAIDSQNGHDAECRSPLIQKTSLVRGSEFAFDFEDGDAASCSVPNTGNEALNISGPFTLSVWVKPESLSVAANDYIINKQNTATYLGYAMWINSGKLFCGVCDSTVCQDESEDQYISLKAGHTYHLACAYDPFIDQMKLYIFEEGVGGLGTTTAEVTTNLVNYNNNLYISTDANGGGYYFDGLIDEMRIYNRKLSDQEIWALQSQGAIAN